MEIQEIIQKIVTRKIKKGIKPVDIEIKAEDLIPYYYYLVNSEMFKDCDLKLTNESHTLQEITEFRTIKLANETKFKGELLFSKISLSAAMYKHDNERTSIAPENGAIISPTFYNTETFVPIKYIQIWFSPEHPADLTNVEVKDGLNERFQDIMDYPDEYLSPQFHGVLLFGAFKSSPVPDEELTGLEITI